MTSDPRKLVKLYDGFHFKLTHEQTEAIRDALDECSELRGTDEMGATLAQVWMTDEGVFCCCHYVPADRVRIIRDVLMAKDVCSLRIDQRREP